MNLFSKNLRCLAICSLGGLFFAATQAHAQLMPAPSPKQIVEQKIGVTTFKLDYSRPSVKERVIFGDLVPYDTFWRTGANQSTKFSFNNDIQINDTKVPAGEYALYTFPGKKKWAVVLSSQLQLPGQDEYDESKEVIRFEVEPHRLNDQVESFTIGFDQLRNAKAIMFLDWDYTRVAFEITLNTKKHQLANIETLLNSGRELNARQYATIGNVWYENEIKLEKAAKMLSKAVEKRPEAFWWMNHEARIHAKIGNKEKAIELAEKSIELAKANERGDFGYIERNEELIASLK